MESSELKSFERIYHSCVIWKIRNYFRNIVSADAAIESPEFVTNLRGHIKWQLALIARRKDGENYVTECILRRSPSCNGPRHIVVKVRLTMKDCSGKYWADSSEEFSFYRNTALSFRDWDIYDSMQNTVRSTSFFKGNFTVFCIILQDFNLHFRESDADADLRALSNDLKAFYMKGNLTDLDLKVHEELFSVHHAIVNARCRTDVEIFNKYPQVREFDLSDFSSIEFMKGLIVYWYSGDMDKLPQKWFLYCIWYKDHGTA